MTRVLSELLGAREPGFRLGLQQLERASGAPSADIRLSSEVEQQMQAKLRELNLDPHDTTGPELYSALQERVKQDDAGMRALLGVDDRGDELTLHVKRLLENLDGPKKNFALKASAAKRLLKKMPPKKAMKQLGYRSVDSMLKHEPVAQLLAAAVIVESPQWHKNFLSQYKQLLPADFEVRDVVILAPSSVRWAGLGAPYVARVKQNVLCFKELGAVVLLPLPPQVVSGAALAMVLLALHAINDIRATSTYLKLQQVRPDFGAIVARVARSEPYTQADLVGERLPWKLVQRYFARNPEAYSAELFEPHVLPEDLTWQPVESTLAKLLDRFAFWKHASHVGLLDHGEPVSLNLTDAALNFCNHLPYEQRVAHYFRDHLWHELMLRYMHQDNLEQTVHDQLGNELVDRQPQA
jgi:hypothetical protein